MALPTLSKAGVPTVTLSRANVFPNVRPKVLNQFVGVSDDNTIRVASVGPPLTTIVLKFEQLTNTDRASIEAFFANALINYGQFSFTFTDAASNAYTVRFLEPQLALPEVTDENVQFDLVLTVVA